MPNEFGLPPGPLSAYLGVRSANQRAGLMDTQNAQGLMSILAQAQNQRRLQEAELEDQKIKGILAQSGGNLEVAIPALMQSGQKGALIANQLMTQQRSGRLVDAQIENYTHLADKDAREAGVLNQRQQAMGALSNLLSPSGSFGQGTDMERPNAQVRPNMTEEEAIQLGRQLREHGNPPTTINVPNPGNVAALALQADPQRAIPELLRQQRAPAAPPPMTPYQQESLRLQRERLNRPPQPRAEPAPTITEIVDPNDPAKTIKVDARTGNKIGDAPSSTRRNPQQQAMYTAGIREIQKDQAIVDGAQQLETALKRWEELNNTTETGRISGARPAVGQPEFQEMVQLQSYLAVNNFKPGQGQISNFERQLIKSAGPNVYNDKETNNNIVRVQLGAVQTAREKAEFKEAYLEANGKLLGADSLWLKYVEKYPRYVRGQGATLIENPNRVPWAQYFGKDLGGSKPPAAPVPATSVLDQADAILKGK